MPANILYISYDGMTDPLGQSQVLPYLIGLSKIGYSISLISCEKASRFKLHHSSINAICQKANIDWQPVMYSKRPPVFSTIYDLIQIRKLAYQLHSKKQFKLVHCRSYLAALIGLDLKKKKDLRFIFDMRGFWADERLDGNIWTLKNPVYRKIYHFFKQKEIDFFTNADYTISLTEAGKKEIQSWVIPEQPIPVEVIPCCVDLDFFHLFPAQISDVENLRSELKIKTENFVLGYLGSIGTWYCLDEMLLLFQKLLQKNEQAKFLFITTEPAAIIFAAAEKYKIPARAIMVQSAVRSEVPKYLALMDCGIFFIKPVFSKMASSPTKQAEMMAMGLPIICNDIGDTGNIVSTNKAGIALNDFSENEIDRAVSAIPHLMKISKNKIRKTAVDNFALTNGIARYTTIYQKLIPNELEFSRPKEYPCQKS